MAYAHRENQARPPCRFQESVSNIFPSVLNPLKKLCRPEHAFYCIHSKTSATCRRREPHTGRRKKRCPTHPRKHGSPGCFHAVSSAEGHRKKRCRSVRARSPLRCSLRCKTYNIYFHARSGSLCTSRLFPSPRRPSMS
jgi:hypothetical protein